jgi:hypothetical protein
MFFICCFIIGWSIMLWLFYKFIKNIPPSSCTGNCNQGRNCTCKDKNEKLN